MTVGRHVFILKLSEFRVCEGLFLHGGNRSEFFVTLKCLSDKVMAMIFMDTGIEQL